jgi:hypothetical protein
MFDQIPPELRSAGPGVAGSLLALFFMRRPPLMLAGMFLGGCIVSYYVTPWLATWLDMDKASGTVGFLVGLFGMASVAKVFDTFEVVNPAELWKAVRQAIRKRLGLEPE